MRAISVRMKFVVPLTIPWTRSTCAPASDSCEHADDRHDAGDRGLEAQLHAVSRGRRPQLLAVLGEQLLVGGHDVTAGAQRAHHVVARRVEPAHQLDDQVRCPRGSPRSRLAAREHARRARPGGRWPRRSRRRAPRAARERAPDRAVAEQADAEGSDVTRKSGRRSVSRRTTTRASPSWQKITGGRGTPL